MHDDTVAAQEPAAPGKATVRLDFAYDGAGPGKGDEGTDVGVDEATNVTDAYKDGDNRFTGKINKVTIDVK